MFHHFSHFRHGREKLAEKLQQVQQPVQTANEPSVSSDPADSNNHAPTDVSAPASPDPSTRRPSIVLGTSIDTSAPSACPSMVAGNIFQELSNDPPCVPSRPDHPVPKTAVRSRTSPISDIQQTPLGPAPETPLQTNKFYANLFLGEQANSAWTQPYSLWWSKGRGNACSWGMSITHTEKSQVASGPQNSYGASNYFFGPIGIQHMALSASELVASTKLYVDDVKAFSVNANFSIDAEQPPILSIPLVQGMGFVTGVYKRATPIVQTSVFFRTFTPCGMINNGATEKYKVVLEDGRTWLIYRTTNTNGSYAAGPLRAVSNSCIQGDPGFVGTIQIAKLPDGISEAPYDASAGAYAVNCCITASSSGSSARYSFSWAKSGLTNPLLMFALPHHVDAFDLATSKLITPIQLDTITKGKAQGVLADQWTMLEKLYTDMGFAPYNVVKGPITNLSDAARTIISTIGAAEIEQDVMSQCCLDSMYFSGKGLGKFAMMIYVLHDMALNPDLAEKGLIKLKAAIKVFIDNQQQNPLVYEEQWKGVVSTAGMDGDAGADFGGSYYNDHHFHYGYFVYAGSVIGYFDSAWLDEPKNTEWINMLVRDFANPVCDDYFPFSRAFDWYNGHSWAKGLFDSADGKDQESSSEDGFASYAIKMWGRVSGNPRLEASGDLRIAIQTRVFCNYFLMESNNVHQPSNFIGNKVTGILFENKIDHATYFGGNIEYIQGIHMIPLSPVSVVFRRPKFVEEEWETYFSQGRVDQIGGGWRGILYANLAIIDPCVAFQFFNQPQFDATWLDGGASRTWYLAYCAALGSA